MTRDVARRLPGTSRRPLAVSAGALAVFATGVGPRPAGAPWAPLYDVVLYNLVFVGAAVACLQAARRRPREATAWRAITISLLCTVTGNLVYTLVIAQLPEEPYPSWADACWLAAYPALYVGLIALIRASVPRFHPSMWLDGVIGALGATAVAVSVLLGPSLALTDGDPAAVAVNLAYPIADVLLLALLVAVGAILGLRGEPVLLLLGAGIAANLVGDIVHLDLAAAGVYVEGGPLDLTWLAGALLLALAAERTRAPARPVLRSAGSRVGWRVLAVPAACNVASLALLAAGWGGRYPDAAMWTAVGCIVTGIARTAMTFHEVRSFHEVHAQARTDELTGLPNRRALLEHTAEVLATATAGRPAAFLLLDLDGFKEVNDSLGHNAGDALLRLIAPRLHEAAGPGALAARLGGDEFAVLLPEATLSDALGTARRVQECLAEPFPLESIRVHVGASIGVATAPVPAADVTDLLRCADVAMYAAKTSREGVRVYLPEPGTETGDRLHTMEELRDALATDQLLVHLQAQVDAADHRVVGVEALVRWQHPTRGLIGPGDLLPAAEQAGLLRPLAAAVLELALTAAAGWWHEHPVPVSVNLSAADVTDLDLPDKVAAALARHGLPAAALTVELVEDTLVTDAERGREVLQQLRDLGVRTSIDDYGSGYSSLGYLRRLPADELKLDRSLTQDLGADPAAALIVQHTVALAHGLGLTVVAEGVEDLSTAGVLADLECDVVQGYVFARPVPVADFVALLRAGAPLGTPDWTAALA
ncbi:putative bifunctional diguanylate cyclase/phosphodiesterase [Geodermatophilus sp. SYSU D00814]